MTERLVALECVVRGVVQGVGFRAFVAREARRLGLRGWVKNERDGSVRVLALGDPASVENLMKSVKEGPPGSRVSEVAVETARSAAQELSGFDVRF